MSNNLGAGGWLAVIVIAAVLIFAISCAFMFAWNVGPAAVFGWPVIAYWWQSLCILVCSALLVPRTIKT